MVNSIISIGLLGALVTTSVPPVVLGRIQSAIGTLAGDGYAGIEDGPIASARFLEPFSLAYQGKRLYVVDRAAQRIRMIYNGSVTTIAGSGEVDFTGQHVRGAYQDGLASTARFNEPTGIAVSVDGSLFVADSLNHCIRKITRNVVTTYAGSVERKAPLDGPLAEAGFEDPRALAFDKAGNLFVADYRVGIRRISLDGTVTTLPLGGVQKEVTGISVFSDGENVRVAATDNHALDIYDDLSKPPELLTDTEAGRALGNPYGVAILNLHQYIVTDVMHHVVKLLRAPLPPFVSGWTQTELAGMGRDSENLSSGYAAGATFEAKLDEPTSIAVASDGTVAIADVGNRRVRTAHLPDMRMPVGDRIEEFSKYPNNYRICFVSSSQAHYTHWWQDSTAGQIESGLRAKWKALQFNKEPVLFSARIDGGNEKASLWDWAEQVPGQGLVDLVILSVFSGDRLDAPDQDSALTKRVLDLKEALAKNNVKLFVAIYPASVEISPLEGLRVRDSLFSHTDDDMRFRDYYNNEMSYAKSVAKAGVPYYLAYPDLLNYEKGPLTSLIFGITDSHFTEFGSYYYGQLLEKALERERPWAL